MLDVLNLPKPQNGYIDYFFGDAISAGTSWRTWEKPRGISMIDITCIGAGGGGRSGWSVDSNARSGGGGGGSGGFSRLLIPAMVLPDVLYVSVGRGGLGGAASFAVGGANAGSNGTFSAVSIAPSTAAIYTACFANGGGGAASGTASASTNGSAAAAATQSSALISGLGQFFALAGQSGSPGVLSTGIVLLYPTTGLLLSGGGAGGGGDIGAGGNLNVPTFFPGFPLFGNGRDGGLVASTAGSGADGISLFQPLMSIGGAGGGSSSSITAGVGSGGRGGNGGRGCGGGGGGAGPSGTGSGAGGNGGDGLVIIQCF